MICNDLESISHSLEEVYFALKEKLEAKSACP
jgi:hypothetical protein